ncbi:hypothetical protein E9549_14795 [Blastococcus sp. MG754426]|uniref:hypothetical protein n=1 Tax=unclassified Blastococcus TaxID=2619396 RepID=UPI001EF11F59|nr:MULTISPECIES: hypothetical protein [unclassified Blastococcus]MCF6508664.1 hypothetical protein [Blastococcus sp. MG754426]MCF6513307.1 hypothetical protein [Blastococcus sp. MG754427]
MFQSVRSQDSYAALIEEYTAEQMVLEARRRRVRNALVHGNPASFTVVESVRDYSEFQSGTALQLGLESYVSASDPVSALAKRTAEFEAMRLGQNAASYWRDRVAARD